MPKVIFISTDGTRREIDTPEGETLMRAATDNLVPGIDGDCGGQCACGTCHVYIAKPWAQKLAGARANETDMLAFVNERSEDSRLACQISVTADLDGIEVRLPAGQH
jgi:2Fe-2S ferredoxin